MEHDAEHRHWAAPAAASAAAGVLHASAAGMHAEHPTLSRLFVTLAVAQVGACVAGLLTARRIVGWSLAAINTAAVAGWIVTRFIGISWIDGLDVAEAPQPADTLAAVLATAAAVLAVVGFTRRASLVRRRLTVNLAAIAAGLMVVPGLVNATSHDHSDRDIAVGSDEHGHDGGAPDSPAQGSGAGASAAGSDQRDPASNGSKDAATAHPHEASQEAANADHADHADGAVAEPEPGAAWPRPWDPTQPIDLSGVPGVTAEQQARAEELVANTLRDLPAFADVETAAGLGWRSIGDADTGFEHFVNYGLLDDDKILDPTAPESLVYRVDGTQRTLVSAMFIATNRAVDDPEMVDYGGALMQWHVHENLCWGRGDDGTPQVVAVLTSPSDTCPAGSINAGGNNPMVHVWIAAHECGPFAALEGHGAGQVADGAAARTDQCAHDTHDAHDGHGGAASADAQAWDPAKPIDLGGVAGVTLEQQAFAENLVAATVRDLPQWADPKVAEAAGFRSIGDAGTGHEHYLNWEWINDDVWLDPDHPESLVYEPQPDGSKRLVSAMYMLPGGMSLDEVPDWGGALMQWHVHGDLCFTDDPEAPQVANVKPLGTSCQPPLVDFPLSPMIHVWITPNECGPFAALEGVGGGQVPDGEGVLCDTTHGSH